MRIVGAATAVAALQLVACSSDPESRVIAPSSTPATRAATIAIVSGNHQTAKAGEPLGDPLVIRISDARGAGVEGVGVSFEVSGIGGLNGKESPGLSRVTSRTDASGRAQVTLEPYDLGGISVTARAEGTAFAPVTFFADAVVAVVEFRSPASLGPYAAFWGPCRCTRTMNAVTVPIGTPVEWVSFDAQPYTITSTAVPTGGSAFDSGMLSRSSRFRFVPAVAGVWEYQDTVSGLKAMLKAQ